MAYEESGIHHAQEFENRFWTIFALLLSTALFFAKDSPVAFGLTWSPTVGFMAVILSGYAMHVWDRYTHRVAISSQSASMLIRRSSQNSKHGLLSQSLLHLRDLGIPVEAQLAKINDCLQEIDQLLIPSTINNFINIRYVQAKEREIIAVFEECDARALNYLISHVKLGLLFYKIKDHRNFHGKHRTELINLLAVERLSILTVMSRVILLHSLQLLKLRANPKAEYWVRHILLNTHQDDLSELKTLTDAKGDYFCMNKLIYDDIRSESVRQDILHHIRREAAVQQTKWQMGMARRKSPLSSRPVMTWRKVLSDVDDTLSCSGGMYPAGVDKRYPKKTIYPGVLAFYRELDLGTQGSEQWEDERVGNLVFLSARPHVYKDMSEKINFAKFEKLQMVGEDGRKGMHTTPSLLAGDLVSGSQFFVTNDYEHLARKKFDNFRRYVGLYPEFQHVFVCDNGQGDVRAGEMMFDSFPYEFEALYVHVVQPVNKTHGYNLERWRDKEFSPFFFRSYPEAALHAASRHPPLIRVKGLQRICQDAVKDFAQIKNWPSEQVKAARRQELNQAIWLANRFLVQNNEAMVENILGEQIWRSGEKVRTPYGVARIVSYDPVHDMYEVNLDWRPLDVQLKEHEEDLKSKTNRSAPPSAPRQKSLETVHEQDESDEEVAAISSGVASVVTTQDGGESALPQAPTRPSSTIDPLSVSEEFLCVESNDSSSNSRTSTSPNNEPDIPSLEVTPPRRYKPRLASGDPSVKAYVSGMLITKYTMPPLPKLERKSSVFTFFTIPDTPVSRDPPKRRILEKGTECSTPYGPVVVVQHRIDDHVVIADMIGWKARAYIHESLVSPLPRNLLRALLRQFSSDTAPHKPLEFPHSTGLQIKTPFGRGSIKRPIPITAQNRRDSLSTHHMLPTMGISLDNWTLANGSHPMLYCTEATARAWKDRKEEDNPSLFFTLGSALVTSSRSLFEPFLQQPKRVVKEELPKTFNRFYQDGAAVTTPFGYGRVVNFRPGDGMYEVLLVQWTLASGSHPRVYAREVDLSSRVASGCQEGYPVLTSLGLSGILASVEPTTGVHIVTISSVRMVCYLQPDCVVRPLKAAVGEDVLTIFGDGSVENYHAARDIYTIRLSWGAKLYAKADTFDRVGEGVQDRDEPFGVNWLLRLLFFSPASTRKGDSNPQSRSRSNSVVSGLSQKSKQ
jgi:hypothetical protein